MTEVVKFTDSRQAVRDAIVKRLEELEQDKEGGGLTADRVVREAEELGEESPFYHELEWDDSKAAHGFRIEQARRLIRKVHVVVETPEHKTLRIRRFVSLSSDRISGGGYRITQRVMSDDEKRAALLDTALAELNALRRKYKNLTELAEVFEAIDSILTD